MKVQHQQQISHNFKHHTSSSLSLSCSSSNFSSSLSNSINSIEKLKFHHPTQIITQIFIQNSREIKISTQIITQICYWLFIELLIPISKIYPEAKFPLDRIINSSSLLATLQPPHTKFPQSPWLNLNEFQFPLTK